MFYGRGREATSIEMLNVSAGSSWNVVEVLNSRFGVLTPFGVSVNNEIYMMSK